MIIPMKNLQRKRLLLGLPVGMCLLGLVFIASNGNDPENQDSAGTDLLWLSRESPESGNCILCSPSKSSLVGHLSVNLTELKQKPWGKFEGLELGGKFRPADCCPEEKLALIIPFQNRTQHLKVFLQHMHPILMRQKRYYAIYLVEQSDKYPFNRATLFNAGVLEALKYDNFDCFIFHDIDTLPVNDRLIYKCSQKRNEILHYAIYQSKWNFTAEYDGYSGGVIAMTRDQFMRINGFSNCYWGWGAEDDDIRFRIRVQKFRFAKVEDETARFISLGHVKAEPSRDRMDYLKTASNRLSVDGLNSLSYKLLGVHVYLHYTKFAVKLEMEKMTFVCNVSEAVLNKELNKLFKF